MWRSHNGLDWQASLVKWACDVTCFKCFSIHVWWRRRGKRMQVAHLLFGDFILRWSTCICLVSKSFCKRISSFAHQSLNMEVSFCKKIPFNWADSFTLQCQLLIRLAFTLNNPDSSTLNWLLTMKVLMVARRTHSWGAMRNNTFRSAAVQLLWPVRKPLILNTPDVEEVICRDLD